MLGFGKRKEAFARETFLTLLIAVGGIATGIGAIWAALAARRQAQVSERQAQLTEKSLTEQRQSFQEQTEIARRQAQLTEQSLAEQNERSRLNLEVDLLTRLADRFDSPHFLSRRRKAAKYLLDNAFADDHVVQVPALNNAAWDVCDFYEGLAHLQRLGVLRDESVWFRFSLVALSYWPLCKPAIEKRREEWGIPALHEEFEDLSRLMAQLDRERGNEPPTQERLRQVMEEEAVIGQEPDDTTTE